jgi:hypothetical protein
MTTTDDKKHLRRFFGKHDSTMAPEGRWPDPELSLPSARYPHFCFSCCTTRFEVVIVKKSETGGDAAFSGGEGERC